jgi:zinc/manganese transport system permease protein
MMLIAAVYGTAASYIGLLVSYHYNLAAGGSIVFVAVAFFGITAVVSSIVARRKEDEIPHQHEHRH